MTAGSTSPRRATTAYLIAVGLALLTVWMRLLIGERLDGPTFILFTVPIIFSAYWGGLGPGLVATGVAFLGASYYLLPPINSFAITSPTHRWQQAILLLVGVLISVICEAMHRTRKRAERYAAEARQRQQELLERDELLSKAFLLSPDCVVIVRLADRTVLKANEALCRLWGSTPEKIIGQPTREYTQWVDEAERVAFMRVLEETGECTDREARLRLHDGREGLFNISARLITLDGEACVLSVLRDITERRQLEAAALTIAAIVTSSDDAIIGKTLDSMVTSWNPSAERIFGYTAAEMIGQSIVRIIPPERRQEERIIMECIGRGEHVRHFETERRAKDGRALAISVTVSPIKDARGRVVGASKIARDITEQKKSELALRTTRSRLHSALDAGAIGTWTWEIATDLLVADEFTARMFSVDAGAAAQGLPMTTYLRAVAVEDQPRVSAGLAHAIETCATYDVEYRVPQANGTVLWLQARGRVEGDAAGKAVNLHGAVMDITDRKRNDGRLRRLVDSNAQGVIFWNRKGEITGANDAFLRIVGYSREDLTAGRVNWAAMTPPEYAHLDQRSLEELATRGICTPFEKEYIRKDGTRVPILLGAASFEDNPDEGVCFLIDITERQQNDRALRESEERFRFLNDLTEATRPLADPGQIMAVTARMLGAHLRASRCAYADVEPDGERFTILHDYTDGCASTVGRYQLSLFGPRAVATLHGGQILIIRDVEAELSPADGAAMFNAIGIKAIITCPLVKEGGLRAMMAVHQATPREWTPSEIALVKDIVERCWATIQHRTAEAKVYQLNFELERRVTERTAELAVANQELEAFSYSVSHDLRAPLRAVDGFSQAVVEDFGSQLPPEGQRMLQTIRNSAQRMGDLIDDLLTFSRLSRQELGRQKIDTDQLVRMVLADLRPESEGRQVSIVQTQLPPCEGDPALLRQVWSNLLSNALKYSGKREQAVVEIGCTAGTVYFVRDNGSGFDMRYADKLFGVFQRLHRQEDYEGTGVGLAIVQRIVQRHGGRVWAEAAVDHGATFYFTLTGETKP